MDQLRDFNSSLDQLVFDKNVYAGLSGSTLTAAQLRAEAGATVATTASQRFIYNLSNGDLFFDPDGTGVVTPTQIPNLNRFNPAFPSDVASANAVFPNLVSSNFLLI